MKVFISWSGENSKKIATYLHDWIPTILQNVRPYMSSENIEKGERWSQDIAQQLQDTDFGIVCVTPDNITAPWILFESGALSKSMEDGRVWPIIFGLSPSDLSKSPLLQFQLTQFGSEDIRKLLVSMNNAAPEPERVSTDLLGRVFLRGWSEVEKLVNEVDLSSSKASESETSGVRGVGESDTKFVDTIDPLRKSHRHLPLRR